MRVAGSWTRRGATAVSTLIGLPVLLSACDMRAGAETEGASTTLARDTFPVVAAATIPEGVASDDVERGRELFLPCAVCHGFDGEGNQLGPSLRDSIWIHIDGSLPQIEQVIRAGVSQPEEHPVPMVPMGGGQFDDPQLRAVASYVYAISRPSLPPAAAPAPATRPEPAE